MEYSLGDLSKITRVSGKTLHRYHQQGLVEPTRIDKFTHHRYYDEKSLHRVEVVNRFHQLGIPPEIIKEVLAKHKDIRHLLKHMQSSLADAEHPWERLGLTRDKIHAFFHTHSPEKCTVGNLDIKILPDVFVASERFHGKVGEIDAHLSHLMGICGSAAGGQPIILFHDDHQYEDEMELECCLPLSEKIADSDVILRRLTGTKAATVVYAGSIESIWMGYQKVIDYLNKQHLAIQSPSREVWLHSNTQNTASEVTTVKVEIQFLIGDPNDPNFTREVSRPGFGIDAKFDL